MENKKRSKKIIFGLAILMVAYFVSNGSFGKLLKGDNEIEAEIENSEIEDMENINIVKEYQKEKEEKIKKLTKKDLLGDIVDMEKYGIVDDAPSVNVEQLLPTDEWKEFLFNEASLVFKYPNDELKEWWIQESKSSDHFIMTTSRSGESDTDPDWAKISVGLYERTADQSIFDWMESPLEKEGVLTPPSDRTVQYVTIGESKFLGSVFFKDHTWTGQKNIYAEVSPTLVFVASLEVQNSTPDSELVGKFDRIFYTMMESLEVKSQ